MLTKQFYGHPLALDRLRGWLQFLLHLTPPLRQRSGRQQFDDDFACLFCNHAPIALRHVADAGLIAMGTILSAAAFAAICNGEPNLWNALGSVFSEKPVLECRLNSSCGIAALEFQAQTVVALTSLFEDSRFSEACRSSVMLVWFRHCTEMVRYGADRFNQRTCFAAHPRWA